MKEAYYFSHDSNASQDEKILNLRADHGWVGYGIYWAIIERLRDTEGYKYRVSSLKGLAASLGLKPSSIHDVIYNYDLFENDGEFFWSKSLINRMQIVEAKREQAKSAGINSGKSRQKMNDRSTDVQQPFNDRSTTVQNSLNENSTDVEQGKERKGNIERKGNENVLTTTTNAREKIFELFEKKIPPGFDPKYEAEKFISMNEAFDWKTKGGRPILENIEKFVNAWISRIMDHKNQNTVKINGNGTGNYQKNQREWGAIFAGACDIVDQFFDKAEHLAGSTN